MKKILSILAIGFLLLSSCTGVKTASSGLENESYLVFIGDQSKYSGSIEVDIDNNTTFNAEVTNNKTSNIKNNVYAIATGTHTITVNYKNNVVYKKQIFISAQETRKIILP